MDKIYLKRSTNTLRMQDIHSELTLLYRTGNVASIEEKYESCNCNETQSKVDASNIGVGSNIETVSGTLLVRKQKLGHNELGFRCKKSHILTYFESYFSNKN